MARTDYITSGNFRLQVYQSDIINPTSSDPYVNVTVYLQAYSNGNGITYPTDDVISFVSMSGSLLNGTYTYSGSVNDVGNWSSGWKTIATIFYQKGIWSVSRTRTSFNVSLSGTCYVYPESGYRRTYSISLSGTVSMAAWPVSGTKDTMSVASSMTMGSSYTVSITHKTSGNKNTLTWKFGSQTGTLLSSSTATSVTFSPSTSLGSQIPSANSGTVTFTLTTYNSSGVNLGSTTYTSTLSVPSYSLSTPTVSAAKNTYTGVGAYVANRTKTRFTLSGLPSGSYGATVTGSYVIKLGSVQQTTGTKTGTSASNVDYTASAAGVLLLTYTVKDSRGKTASASASVTYIANQAPTINFAADRDPNTLTTWIGEVSGTYLNVSGNTVTITYSSGTGTAPTAADGAYSGGMVTGTGLAETSSLNVTATVTDTLGNTASKSVRISTVFAYMEATPNKVISFGRKASTNQSDRLEFGLPAYFDDDLSANDANGIRRAKFGPSGMTYYDANGNVAAYYPAAKTSEVVNSAYANQPIMFMRAGNTVSMFFRDPKGLTPNATTNLGVIVPAGFRPFVPTDYPSLAFDAREPGGNGTVRIFVSGTGLVEIYNYTNSTGTLNIAATLTWAAD